MKAPPHAARTACKLGLEVSIVSLVGALVFCSPDATAYEATTTHAGLSGRAGLSSNLHRFLQEAGLPLGLFTPLQIDGGQISAKERSELSKLSRAGGYAPDKKLGQWALGWLMAGSVLQGNPSLERHHFYCPTTKKGLDDSAPLGWMLRLLLAADGGGFSLRGQSGVRWIRSEKNPHSVAAFADAMSRGLLEPSPLAREHNLARALTAIGGLLHVLQDMASPSRVRNDPKAHLYRVGHSVFDRASAYERFVALRYGRIGLPRPSATTRQKGKKIQGTTPISRRDLVSFFTTPDGLGLADRAHREHFSPGTVPKAIRLEKFAGSKATLARIQGTLPFPTPLLGPLKLLDARSQTQYLRNRAGQRRLAYAVGADDMLRFYIDGNVMGDTARVLLPQALAYSTGLINHLLGTTITISRDERGHFTVKNGSTVLSGGKLHWLTEDSAGLRKRVGETPLRRTLAAARLGTLDIPLPAGIRLYAVLVGKSDSNDPVVAVTSTATPATEPPSSAPTSTPSSAPSSAPTSTLSGGPVAKPAP